MGALDTHNLEQHEYMDRSRAYSKRIEAGRIKLPETASCLLKDIPAPERILAADPLVAEDQELVNARKDTFLHLSHLSLRQLNLRPIKVIHATNIIDYRNAQQGCDSIKWCESRTQGRFGGPVSIVIVKCLLS